MMKFGGTLAEFVWGVRDEIGDEGGEFRPRGEFRICDLGGSTLAEIR